jgi:hypothetical protein
MLTRLTIIVSLLIAASTALADPWTQSVPSVGPQNGGNLQWVNAAEYSSLMLAAPL